MKRKAKKNNPQKLRNLGFLSHPAYDIYINVGYIDGFGRSTPLTEEEMEEYEEAYDLIEKAGNYRYYEDFWPYIKKADKILTKIHDSAMERHRTITIPKSMRAGKRNPKRK